MIKMIAVFIFGFIAGFLVLFIWALFQNNRNSVNIGDIKTFNAARVPFDDKWFVFWGGNTVDQNNHNGIGVQHCAMDFIGVDINNKSFRTDGLKNEDYFCWGRSIKTIDDGIVSIVVDGIPDCIPSIMNQPMLYGNVVIIKYNDSIFGVYAHLQNGSTRVKVGDTIKIGQEIGLCGNSGNSSEPHLHFHMQTDVGFNEGNPVNVIFNRVIVNNKIENSVSLIKGNIVSNE